ncbi:MAG: EAL domain-containing protein [Gallionella sp.]|jgi:diguanylate cyclase (GGDEF)-like protein/PAS domain S-box-containing protein
MQTPQDVEIYARRDYALELLKISESRYRRLFETARDGILLLNAVTAQIEDVNPYLIEMLGYSHEEFLGKKLWEVGSFADIAQSKEMFSELQTDGYVRYKDLPLKTKAGAKIAVEFVSNTYDCAGILVIQCNIRDITERNNDQAKIQRNIQLYAALSECNKAIVHCVSEEALFLQVCQAAVNFGGMKMAWVGLIAPETQMVNKAVSFGDDTRYLDDVMISLDLNSTFGHSPTGTAIRDNQPYWCQDFLNDPLNTPWHERAMKAALASSASLPLYRHGLVIGAFILYSGEARAFDEPARNLLVEMSLDISFALDNLAREEQRKLNVDEIQFRNTILLTQQETSLDAILVVDENVVIISFNQKFLDMWLMSPDSAPTCLNDFKLESVAGQLMYPEIFIARVQYLNEQRVAKSREEIVLKDGRTIDQYSAPITCVDGKYHGRVWYFRDITERKVAENKIEQLAFYDPLTSLPNRRLLHDRLQHALVASARHDSHGAILFIDLDNFKTLNDTQGHNVGDLLLTEVANRLQGCVRERDTVARVGGDEFVVILEELSADLLFAVAQTKAIGDKILASISQKYLLNSFEYYCSTSIGVSLFLSQEVTEDELLKRADTAMYQAKSAGRNTMRFYDPAMQAVLEIHAALERDLRRAGERDQFKIYYQMQVDDKDRIIGAEALIRWQHPQRGLVSPQQFIPLAEESDLILSIGQWVLQAACIQLKAWEADPLTCDLHLSVNVSARQFQQPDFVDQVCQTIQQHGVNAKLLKLELTEGLVLGKIDEAIFKMNALQELGVRFSMDDFGTGYSSLAYLTKLPLDQLKIDQSFVHNVGVKKSDALIVQTIIGMAQNLGLEVIAEGVETQAQRDFLQQHGCQLYQGALFGNAVPVEEFIASLKALFITPTAERYF